MTNNVDITILVDNTTVCTGVGTEHGLSIRIEAGDRQILLDAGQTELLIRNARILHLDLAGTDAVIISHGHFDHTGGLAAVLDMAPNAWLYMHPQALRSRFSIKKSHPPRNIGIPESVKKRIQVLDEIHRVIRTQQPTEVSAGVFITGTIARHTTFEDTGGSFFLDPQGEHPDDLVDDQAVFLEMRQGMVVILGCAHAGVVNTLDYVSSLTGKNRFYAVLGGVHLLNASSSRLHDTVEAFQYYDVQKIGLAHCTGDRAVQSFQEAFPDRMMDCSAGCRIRL